MKGIKISLKAARVNAGYTQKQVAAAMKVSPVTVVAWENGKVEPSYASLKYLSDMYKMPMENIFLPEILAKSKRRKK